MVFLPLNVRAKDCMFRDQELGFVLRLVLQLRGTEEILRQ